jgi:hypothetical protein
MQAAAAEEFPRGVPQNFAWKFKDGDAVTDAAAKEKTDETIAAAQAARVNTGRYDDERLSTTPLPPDAYRD